MSWAACCALLIALGSAQAEAQPRPRDEAIADDDGDALDDDDGGLAEPAPAPPAAGQGRDVQFFQQQWEQRRRALKSGDPAGASNILDDMLAAKDASGWPDFFVYGRALARESEQAIAAGRGQDAVALAQAAVRLAPHCPSTHRALASAQWAGGELTAAAITFGKAVAVSWWEPPLLRAQLGNLALAVALGSLLTGLAFALVGLYRYGRGLTRDMRRLLPAGTKRWQATFVVGALFVAPLLFRLGLAWVTLLWVVGLGLYYRPRERIGAILVVLALGGIPLLAPTLTSYWVYPGSRAHTVYRASRALLATDAEAAIAARVDRTANESYALGLRAAWSGKPIQAVQHLEAAAKEIEDAELYTLLGNMRFAMDRHAEAVEAYTQATRLDPNHVVAFFNMSRVLFQMGEHQRGNAAYRQGTAIDFELSERYARIAKTEGRGYVVPQGAPRRLLALAPDEKSHQAAVEQVWSWLCRGTPRLMFAAAAMVGMVLLAAMAFLRRPLSFTDLVELPAGSHTAKLNLQKEIAAHRYQANIERLARFLGLLIAGGAQLARGSTLSGLALMVVFVSSLVLLAGLWGLVPVPGVIEPSGLGTLHSVVAAGAALGSYGLALWVGTRET